MTAARPRRWRRVLTAGAVLALGGGLVVGLWFKPAATTQPAAMSTPVVDPPATLQAVADQVAPPPTADNTWAASAASPAVSADTADPSDLSRLRSRALTLPVAGVSVAQLSDTYTQARAAGVPHEAIDIMAARGTPVLAVEDGRIAKLFLSKPGGITLYQFDPGGEFAYYYAHLDSYADGVAEGGTLRKGQVIGYVGSTGNASPDSPHLHFAIYKLGPEKQWWRGTPLNPYLVWRDARP